MDEKKKLLITGVSGMLGSNLAYYFKNKYDILGLYNLHPVWLDGILTEKCELSKPDTIATIIKNYRPHIIIHCASLTNIDECESDKITTTKINVEATKNIIEAVHDRDTKIIYISSDSVYDGRKGFFSEDDEVNPQNHYGLSKYRGELEVSQHPQSLILRTNLFGWNVQDKNSLAEWILKNLKQEKKINGFKDVYFSSIYTMEIARVVEIALKKEITGTYNCGAVDSCSKYEFALKMAHMFNYDPSLIIPISISQSNLKAKRGNNLSLNVDKLQKTLDYKFPSIDQSILTFYRDNSCGLPNEIRSKRFKEDKINELIPYGRQWIDFSDIAAVVNVLRSRKITQGPTVDEFEDDLAAFCQVKHAVAVNSGTSALHIACLAAGIGNGDEVITSPISFVASANCAVYCKATPVFADIDPKTYNLSPEAVAKKISKKTRAVIPVHFAGQSCDMRKLQNVIKDAEKQINHKIYIIEDASHALGSKYRGTKVGSCAFSDMTTMSFHPVKHITTGEGGIALTNDEGLYNRLKLFRSHGITSLSSEFIYKDQAFPGFLSNNPIQVNPWYYEQQWLGYNYRMTNIQAALGRSQLKKLNRFKETRKAIVKKYNKAFGGIDVVQIPIESGDCDSNYHLYVLLIDYDKLSMRRMDFMKRLMACNIQTQVHYIPVHTQPFYQKNFGTRWGDLPEAEYYYQRCLSIPLFHAMTEQQVDTVIKEITRIVRGAR